MEHFYTKPPDEVCENPSDYSNWILCQYEGQSRFGQGEEDIINARNLYDLHAPVRFAVWRACRKRFDSSKTRNFKTSDLFEIIQENDWVQGFDKTAICHSIGMLRALGLVYRVGDKKEYEYSFEEIILEKGMDWFLKGNKFINYTLEGE